jgi:acylphosphatase
MNKHIHINISGLVHGVGFRFSAYEKFVELGLEGKAENIPGAGVLVDAQGPEDKLASLVEWCKQGPAGAKVSGVEVADVAEPFVPLKNG